MKVFPNQPSSIKEDIKGSSSFIASFLKDELPDCPTNTWFINSVYFVNMIDQLVRELSDSN